MLTHIRTIRVDDCLWLRHQVLWPQFPLDYSRVEGDDQAQHFGLYLDEQLISCLSVFSLEGGECQLRKFATAQDAQHQGHGSRLLEYVIAHLQGQCLRQVCLNARLSATPFYARFGFNAVGPVYHKEDIAYVLMERKL